jgi:hypothetical protein
LALVSRHKRLRRRLFPRCARIHPESNRVNRARNPCSCLPQDHLAKAADRWNLLMLQFCRRADPLPRQRASGFDMWIPDSQRQKGGAAGFDRFQPSSRRLQKPLFSGPKTNPSQRKCQARHRARKSGAVRRRLLPKRAVSGESDKSAPCFQRADNRSAARKRASHGARRFDAPFHLSIYALCDQRAACLALECR